MNAVPRQKEKPTLQLPPIAGGPWGVTRAYEYCKGLAGKNNEDYPVATWLLPKSVRNHFATIYAFARTAEDFARRPEYEGRRAGLLDAWEDALTAAYYGEAVHPVFVALKNTISEHDLPRNSFLDIIAGHRMDLRVQRYPTFAALLKYCEKAANPVGRIMLSLLSDNEPEHIRAADDFCTGIQLLDHWQQVGVSYDLGRIYIPEEDMLRFGVSEADIRQRRVSKQFKALLAFEIARTRSYFLRSLPLIDFVPKRLRPELQLIAESALCSLDAIERAGYDVYSGKSRMTKLDWARAGASTLKARVRGNLPW